MSARVELDHLSIIFYLYVGWVRVCLKFQLTQRDGEGGKKAGKQVKEARSDG